MVSQIFDRNAFKAIETMGRFLAGMKQTGRVFPILDLGGGFAATYTREDAPIPVKEVGPVHFGNSARHRRRIRFGLEASSSTGSKHCRGSGLHAVSGRLHENDAHKRYVFVDGGMSDKHPSRFVSSKYRAEAAEKNERGKTETYSSRANAASRRHRHRKRRAATHRNRDILVVYTTGAYGYSMASNYNLLRSPLSCSSKTALVACRAPAELEDLVAGCGGRVMKSVFQIPRLWQSTSFSCENDVIGATRTALDVAMLRQALRVGADACDCRRPIAGDDLWLQPDCCAPPMCASTGIRCFFSLFA